jgi:hypothetical protein
LKKTLSEISGKKDSAKKTFDSVVKEKEGIERKEKEGERLKINSSYAKKTLAKDDAE